ncbi:unnamed protein product [Symbiodinium sp. CCMP2592]|nr:unnamed protein product [Symbiodinium sp. CCMP2592]
MTLVVQCRIPDGWKDSQDAREAALRSVRPEAMALGEMLLYREASKRALKALGAKPLWIGARASFEKFSGTDPLLFVGINKLVFFAIAGLCVNKNLAAVVISFLLLTIGVSRGDPHGTRSRNALGFVCCLFLTVYSCLLLLFEDFALSSISQAAVVAGPTCYYLHLQLMPADLTIEAYSLLARLQGLDPAKEATPESPTIPTVEERTVSMVPRAKWSWEEHRFLRSLFRGYRQRVVPQLAISGQRLMAIETQSLHGVGRMVRLLAGRGTVTQHPPAVELRTRAPG